MHFDVLALQGSSLGGLAATGDVLETANRLGAEPGFSWRVVSQSRTVSLRQGVTVASEPFASARPSPWIVVLGLGSGGPEEVAARLAQPDVAKAARWLRQATTAGSQIASACTGAFLLSEAGVLDGRRCTTSWWLQGLLARRTPAADVETDAMVVADDPIWTAGAAYAHLDLMLAVLAEAASPELAQSVGRRLAVDRRPSQGAYMEPGGMGGSELVSTLETAIAARLSDRIRLEDLVKAVGISPRTLTRRVQAETGLSPMRFVQKVRLDAALRLIRASKAPLSRIAESVGLADAATLHRLVVRHTCRSPGSFRSARSWPE